MLRAVLGLGLASTFAAAAAHAGTILYATAATTGEVSSYCVRAGGGLDVEPLERVPTTGNAPSRLITLSTQPDPTQPPKQFLYAAQNDRVQVWQIGETGRLRPVGRIPALPIPDDPQAGLLGMNPHDIDISVAPDGSRPVLYVPQRAFERIAAFPLDPNTGLSTVPTGFCATSVDCTDITECGPGQSCVDRKCVSGPTCITDLDCPNAPDPPTGVCQEGICLQICDPRATNPDAACTDATIPLCRTTSDQAGASCVNGPAEEPAWEDVVVANGLLYASRAVTKGEVRVYQLAADGNFAPGIVLVEQPGGFCATGVDCNKDADCGQGEACVDGRCVSGPTCASDADCPNAPNPPQPTGACQKGICLQSCDPDANDPNAPCTNPASPVCKSTTETRAYPFPRPSDTCVDPVTNSAGEVVVNRGQVEPYARRRRLNGAAALIGLGTQTAPAGQFTQPSASNPIETIYVAERFRRTISAFELCPSAPQPKPDKCAADPTRKGCPCTPPPPVPAAGEVLPPAPADAICPAGGFYLDAKFNDKGQCTYRYRQKRLSRTHSDIRYNAMALAERTVTDPTTGQLTSVDRTILGSQFLDGRIDGYRLHGDSDTDPLKLPRKPSRRTNDNFRTSPFRLFVYRPADVNPAESAGVVYVGAGDINRVQAYRLNRVGLPRDKSPFSETTVLDQTFPNDVIVVELPGACS